MSRRRVTMDDVADLAGVSYQTVSRVINNRPEVREATRERVQKVITEIGYRPSHIARSLATARTATIGLVVPNISNPFFSAIARGAEQVASEQGYTILLCSTNEEVSREVEVLHLLHERYVDGVIVCGSREKDEPLREELSHFNAVVLVNRQLAGEPFPAVLVDDSLGGYLITRHLLELGHTSIGFLAGPSASYSGAGRFQGYKQALQEAGIEQETGWVQHCSPTIVGGQEAAHSLLTKYPQISAIFCYNDLVALGALRGSEALGQQVPDDISITGFDDIMLASVVSPALTTCHIPRVEIGSQAVTMLLKCISDDEIGCSEIFIHPELIIRESSSAKRVAITI